MPSARIKVGDWHGVEQIVCISVRGPYVRVGCAVHHIDWWRQHWSQMAQEHGASLREAEQALHAVLEVMDGC